MTDEDILLKEVAEGIISNWYELEMKTSLFGIEIKSGMIEKMLTRYLTSNTYTVLYKAMTEESVMDEYFSDYSLISKFLEMNKKDVYGDISVISSPHYIKFRAVEMLKSLDLRNPKYLLKYFLYDTTQPNSKNRDSYFMLFLDIIERTKIRANKMKVFDEYLTRLNDSYAEKRNFELMCK